MSMMKAAVFIEPGRIELVDKPIPPVGPNDALVRITTTTICGTDVHILKGEYPVARGLTIGHEPVGIIEKLGSNVRGYQEGQRVIAGAICPSFSSYASQDGYSAQDGGCSCHGYKPMGGWRFGNSIDGTQAEYVLVPDAQGNLAPVPDGLTDEQVLMCPDIMSTGFAGAEAGNSSLLTKSIGHLVKFLGHTLGRHLDFEALAAGIQVFNGNIHSGAAYRDVFSTRQKKGGGGILPAAA